MIDRRHFMVGAASCGCAARSSSVQAAEHEEPLMHFEFCTMVPPDNGVASRATALDEWDGNIPSSNTEAALLKTKRWNPARRELRVDFLSTSPLIDRIIRTASGWEEHMPLRFIWGQGTPDILVGFVPGDGHWSNVGTDSKLKATDGLQSMNFGWTAPPVRDREVRRVALHEFGHALGLIHEHQNPDAAIPWNEAAVYEYYRRTQGWDEDETKNNVLERYRESQVNRTDYDSDSIMLYAIPREVLTNPAHATSWNTRLSPGDIAMAQFLFS